MDLLRRHRRVRAFAAALIVVAAGSAAAAAKITPAQVNAAARLAMLAERMAKVNAQLGREVLVSRSRRALAESIAQFDRGLREASAAASTAEARENYRLLKRLWDEYRAAVLRSPSRENALRIAERSEEIVWIADKGTRMLHEQSSSRASDLVLAAGVGRTAAQRLAKLHLQHGWAIPGPAPVARTTAAERDVERAITLLGQASETNEAIALELPVAESQLAFLRSAAARLDAGEDRARQLEHIAKTADNIAEILERAARFYETLSLRD